MSLPAPRASTPAGGGVRACGHPLGQFVVHVSQDCRAPARAHARSNFRQFEHDAPRQMCLFDRALLKERKPRLRVMIGEAFRAQPDLLAAVTIWTLVNSPFGALARTGQSRHAIGRGCWARSWPGPCGVPASACGRRAAGCGTGTWAVDRDLVEVRRRPAARAAYPGRRRGAPAAAGPSRSRCPARHWPGRRPPARSRRRSCRGSGRAPSGRPAAAARSSSGTSLVASSTSKAKRVGLLPG